MFGNALKGPAQIENVLLAKLLSMNSLNLAFADCNFAESNMTAKDPLDGLTREGSCRVAVYKETGLPNCYTLEASFHGSKRLNFLAPKLNKEKMAVEPEQPLTSPYSKIYDGQPAVYTPELYGDMGRVCPLPHTHYRQCARRCSTSMTSILSRGSPRATTRP